MGKEDFMNAVKTGDSQFVRKALYKYRKGNRKGSSKRVGINYADADGFTALHYAALSGDVEIVMAIIHMEADTNIRDLKGMTPLHMSAWAGKPEALACLLENRALPNLPAFSGDTPLHLAAQHGYAACAKVLLSAHADGCFRNGFLETPLDLACQYGHTAVVKELLAYENVREMLQSPVIDNRYKSPLHLAAKSGHDDIVHLLLKAGANVNEERAEGTPLHVAALYGKTEAVRLLLRAGASVSIRNNNNLLPLDVVNKFTTSRAGLEIKQLLREAAGEHVVYAKAICDYNNPSLKNSISFKANECIAVIERNEDGCWKGYVVNSKHERIGYFPSMTVQLIAKTKKTMSVSSFSSQASSSADSTSGRSTTSGNSPEKGSGPASPKHQPVGVVPVGSYEVVALSKADPEYHSFPKQTANGCFTPGMGSFKQKNNATTTSAANSKTLQRSFSAQTANMNMLPASADMRGNRSASTDETDSHLKERGLDDYQTKSLSDDGRLKFAQTLSRQIAKTKYGNPSEFRQRTLSGGTTHSGGETPRTHPTPVVMSPNARHMSPAGSVSREPSRSTPQSPYNRPRAQTTSVESPNSSKPELQRNCSSPYSSNHVRARTQSSGSSLNNNELARAFQEQALRRKGSIKYANVEVTPTSSPVSKEPYQPTDYTTVFVSDSNASDVSPAHSVSKLKPILSKSSSFKKTMSSENPDYENVFENKPKSNSVSFARTPEEKRKMQLNHGYETMNPAELSTNPSESVINRPPDNEIYAQPKIHMTKEIKQEIIYQNTVPDEEDGTRFLTHGDGLIKLEQKLSTSEKDLFKWLTELKLQNYLENFTNHGFDMISMRAITPEDLNVIGIIKTGHRKKILSEVAKLSPSNELPVKKPHDVGSWLGALNLRQYEPNFIEGGFDDIDFIKDLDRNDLEMIDIKKKGHQKKILMAVQCLHDLELTAILDQAVAQSPVSRASSLRREVRPEVQEFFAATSSPTYTMSSVNYPLSPRDDLPPPSGEEQIGVSPNHNWLVPKIAPKPSKKPVPLPEKQKPPKPDVVPRTKPKPAVKPMNNYGNTNGQVNEITNNMGRVSMNAPSEIQGNQEEEVTSTKSRDFFKRQEEHLDVTISPNNTLARSRTASNSSSSSNASTETRMRPQSGNMRPPLTKMKPALSTDQRSFNDAPPTPPKKAPPPAPPKRRSSSKGQDTKGPEVTVAQNPPPSQPIAPSPQLSDFLPPPPIMSPPPLENISEPSSPLPPPPSSLSITSNTDFGNVTPEPPSSSILAVENSNIESQPAKKGNVNDMLSETDNIMANIMADLDDFSSQIDNMF